MMPRTRVAGAPLRRGVTSRIELGAFHERYITQVAALDNLSNMLMNVRALIALAGAAGLVLDSACFAYVPITTGSPPMGADVRLQLSSEGTTELTRYLGPGVRSVDGRSAAVRGDSAIVVAATSTQALDGSRQPWNGAETVAFPRAYLTSVQLRTIDRPKSTVAAVLIAASLVTIGVLVMRGGGAGGGAPDNTGGTGVFSRR
jgi:hypothetical protein